MPKATQVAWGEAETWARMKKHGPALPFESDAGPGNIWVLPHLGARAFPASEHGLEILQCLPPL